MVSADFNKNNKIAWFRVVIGIVVVVVTTVSAMALMLFYRLAFLPAAISEFCPNQEQNFYCIANVMQQLKYANQWLAIQFIVYLLLSFLLYPIFIKAKGIVLLNLLLVAVGATAIINFSASELGIELYASFLCPLFIGLLIKYKKDRKIIINVK
jgi:hypothetical protein